MAKPVKAVPTNLAIEKLIEGAIPVSAARFHAAVNNGLDTPESTFNAKSDSPARQVQMWASYAWLICLHNEKYILVPLSNVIFAKAS